MLFRSVLIDQHGAVRYRIHRGLHLLEQCLIDCREQLLVGHLIDRAVDPEQAVQAQLQSVTHGDLLLRVGFLPSRCRHAIIRP